MPIGDRLSTDKKHIWANIVLGEHVTFVNENDEWTELSISDFIDFIRPAATDFSQVNTWEDCDMWQDKATSEAEPVTYTMSIGYDQLKQRRERSRRVWRKYG